MKAYVTKKDEEVALDEEEKMKRAEALKNIIDREVVLNEDGPVIEDESKNPLEPVLNQ